MVGFYGVAADDQQEVAMRLLELTSSDEPPVENFQPPRWQAQRRYILIGASLEREVRHPDQATDTLISRFTAEQIIAILNKRRWLSAFTSRAPTPPNISATSSPIIWARSQS